jgi:hypothetical protein
MGGFVQGAIWCLLGARDDGRRRGIDCQRRGRLVGQEGSQIDKERDEYIIEDVFSVFLGLIQGENEKDVVFGSHKINARLKYLTPCNFRGPTPFIAASARATNLEETRGKGIHHSGYLLLCPA